jgi:ribosomal protein S27E
MGKEILPIEVICPECKHTEIIYLQKEDMPKCPKCEIRMTIREVLREGKSY